MKKILILWILLLSSLLYSKEDYASVFVHEWKGKTVQIESNRSKSQTFKDINISLFYLKSTNPQLNINNIKNYEKQFQPLKKEERFDDQNMTYWLRIDLGKNFPNGRFVYCYGDMAIKQHTFTPLQGLEKFSLHGVKHLQFSYDKNRDPQTYYFALEASKYETPYRFLSIETFENFYKQLNKHIWIILLLGLIMGLIVMAGLYNGALYYYNRDRSFLDYALMQLFIALTLFNFIGLLEFYDTMITRNVEYNQLIGILASIFATRFTQSFLDTKVHLPRTHQVLQLIITLLLIDIILIFWQYSWIIHYNLIPFFALIYLYAGFKRWRAKFKPAIFYLLGWFIFIISLFGDAFAPHEFFFITPLYIGSAIEAILLSLALSYKVKMIADERQEQKEMMIHQSRLASMGEMLGNIAHQWRQPLNYLSYSFMNIEAMQKSNQLSGEYLSKKVFEANAQLEFMSQTIEDFKDFYVPKKSKEHFSLANATQETLELMQNSLHKERIEIVMDIQSTQTIYNYKNEYKQVLLNLFTNAKEAFNQSNTQSPKITLTITQTSLTVEDNAGGIEPSLQHRIFEPYFSTKEGNSGIGLYLSKMVVEKRMGGELEVENSEEGALFYLKL